jgi:hypothetical protein
VGEHRGFVRDAEDWAALAEREAHERVSRVEAESTTVLASARGEGNGLAQRIAHLEGELAEVCHARDMVRENSRGLSDMATDAERLWEESMR